MNSSPPPADASHLNTLKEEVRGLGKDAAKLAHDHLMEPITNMVHDAQNALQLGSHRAQDVISEKFTDARKAIATNMTHTQEIASRQCDRASSWISANPFTSVGVAVLAGMTLALIGRRQ